MTYTASAAQPTSPASPLAVTLFKDNWGAVQTTDADTTTKQRAIEIGTPIPIVFAKEDGGIGGVWVYPGAARYAVQADTANSLRNTTETNTDLFEYIFNIGLVVSEGQIGSIAAADVRKGSLTLTGISNSSLSFAYGSMPSVGFSYINTAKDFTKETTVYSQAFFQTVDIAIPGNITRFDIVDLHVMYTSLGTKALFTYQILIGSTVIYDDGITHSSDTRSYYARPLDSFPSIPWSNNVTVRITTLYSPSEALEAKLTVGVQKEQAATTSTMVEYGFPEDPGSGGTFADMSCLAVKGTYDARILGTNNVKDGGADVRVEPCGGSGTSITYTNLTSFSVSSEVTDSGLTYIHGYKLYINGDYVRDNDLSYTTYQFESFSSQTGSPFDITYEIFPFPGNTFPATAICTFTLEYSKDAPSNSAVTGMWDDQIRCFVRNGIQVNNVLTSTTASSNNFADLVYYMLTVCAKVPVGLIDTSSFVNAATFFAANNMRFDGVIATQVNIKEYLDNVAPMFMVYCLQVDGKYVLRPVLPTNIDGTLNSGAISPTYTFDRTNIEGGSYSRQYITLNDRKDICALLKYRDQSGADYSVEQVAEVRYTGTAADGPFQEFDLSEFCSNITQAGFVGKYILANRKHVTHTIRFSTNVKIGQIAPLDIVRVRWNYADVDSGVDTDTRLYQINRVSEFSTGLIDIEATHFPVNASSESLVIADILGGSYTGP